MGIDVDRVAPIGRTGADRLTEFFARELDCSPTLFARSGTYLFSSTSRDQASWLGFTLPFLLLSRHGSTIMSVTKDLLPPIQAFLSRGQRSILHPATIVALLDIVEQLYPDVKKLRGRALYSEPEWFKAHTRRTAHELLPEHPMWDFFRQHFDGPVYATRSRSDELSAWAAIKRKSEDIWEIAVETEQAYRGRGLGLTVVSAATHHILEGGRVPLYVYDEGNASSARVARALGYREFGMEAYCSLAKPGLPTSMW